MILIYRQEHYVLCLRTKNDHAGCRQEWKAVAEAAASLHEKQLKYESGLRPKIFSENSFIVDEELESFKMLWASLSPGQLESFCWILLP